MKRSLGAGLAVVLLLTFFYVFFLQERDDPEQTTSGMRIGTPFTDMDSILLDQSVLTWEQAKGNYVLKHNQQTLVFNASGVLTEIRIAALGDGLDSGAVHVGDSKAVFFNHMGNPDGSSGTDFIYHRATYDLSIRLMDDHVKQITLTLKNPSASVYEDAKKALETYYENREKQINNYIEGLAAVLAEYDIYFINKHDYPERNQSLTGFDLYQKMVKELQELKAPPTLLDCHQYIVQSYQEEVERLQNYEDYLNHKISMEEYYLLTDKHQLVIDELRTKAYGQLLDSPSNEEHKNLYLKLQGIQEKAVEQYKSNLTLGAIDKPSPTVEVSSLRTRGDWRGTMVFFFTCDVCHIHFCRNLSYL